MQTPHLGGIDLYAKTRFRRHNDADMVVQVPVKDVVGSHLRPQHKRVVIEDVAKYIRESAVDLFSGHDLLRPIRVAMKVSKGLNSSSNSHQPDAIAPSAVASTGWNPSLP
jgi:hypothetical protein